MAWGTRHYAKRHLRSHAGIRASLHLQIEADDIIAIICMYYKELNNKQEIYIISGDKDFLQLGKIFERPN